MDQLENVYGASSVDELYSAPRLMDSMSDATVMLAAVEAGEPQAAEKLLVLIYDELRRLAASKLAHEAPGQTLQPTALVHEAWLRLVGDQNPSFKDRKHFFCAAAEAMRHILIDRAAPSADEQLLAVHEALHKLGREHATQAEVVKLRYFGGLTNEEISEVLGISISTVKNYWTFSRAWLLNEIEGE